MQTLFGIEIVPGTMTQYFHPHSTAELVLSKVQPCYILPLPTKLSLLCNGKPACVQRLCCADLLLAQCYDATMCRGRWTSEGLDTKEVLTVYTVQATLSFDAKAGERVGVTAKINGNGPHVLICSLREGTCESLSLDLVLNS